MLMVTAVADNITSPLGVTTAANCEAVARGDTGLRRLGRIYDVERPVVASLFPVGVVDDIYAPWKACGDGSMTRFEKLLVASVSDALSGCDVNAASPSTIFVISSTKGNIECLENGNGMDVSLPRSAAVVARHFGNANTPIVVSNACISGVSAQILAMRLLESGRYDHAVVAGCDVLSRFIVSGFQSFKALAEYECRPFDASRCGLNLGEAAATIIYSSMSRESVAGRWTLRAGAMRNDSNHISGPSRVGEGSFRCLKAVTQGCAPASIAFVNAHGTATLYNDEMESVAIDRAGLADCPVNALKGYYGHTLGAAGVLETIISMHAYGSGYVPATRGYASLGVSRRLKVSSHCQAIPPRATGFIKMLSGFGGCNAALRLGKGVLES